ncbi:MAG: hypothetical protein IMZ61_15040 [Planctomycetes bacterium]|nr:hypothetical protein [Planctomycetota bacterium]
MPKSESVTITIPLDPGVVEGIINGDKVCLNLISKAVQAAIEQGHHLRKTEEAKSPPATPGGHRCVVSDDVWEFLQSYCKAMGQTLTEV